MEFQKLRFVPIPPVPAENLLFDDPNDPSGLLEELQGTWTGTGFNNIWRPLHPAQFPEHHFLELNVTSETTTFSNILDNIPNRGLLNPDIAMAGIVSLQMVSDSNLKALQHVEPGFWAVVPATQQPNLPATVVRMGSIPHGTTILAQGFQKRTTGGPTIPNNDMIPFDSHGNKVRFKELDLKTPCPGTRSDGQQLNGITQPMIDNPTSVLQNAIQGQTILETRTIRLATDKTSRIGGGGTLNTAFLEGDAHTPPNADVIAVEATFWIEKVQGTGGNPDFMQLQYLQTVFLKFLAFTWPHVTVGTLIQQTQ
ncbi:MAG: heme-binding protein [Candidatus Eremiobacteraeota bacterium]|nr:heme-binding protein [Candidatus Eremiobacteraeota bacterium]